METEPHLGCLFNRFREEGSNTIVTELCQKLPTKNKLDTKKLYFNDLEKVNKLIALHALHENKCITSVNTVQIIETTTQEPIPHFLQMSEKNLTISYSILKNKSNFFSKLWENKQNPPEYKTYVMSLEDTQSLRQISAAIHQLGQFMLDTCKYQLPGPNAKLNTALTHNLPTENSNDITPTNFVKNEDPNENGNFLEVFIVKHEYTFFVPCEGIECI
jgi:hypothetical protein